MASMYQAYRAAQRLIDEELPAEDRDLLGQIEGSSVVVVRGNYDRVEDVLDIVSIRHQLISPESVGRLNLRPEQLLIVNCPGNLNRKALTVVREFVARGGSLFTTDWALRNVLEPAFPGLVAYNNRPTADDVVRIEIRDRDNPFLDGVFHEGADPLWWLEGSSYPIRILEPAKVEVLITSNELEGKYGEAPVAITFRHGEGEVFHMISHYYLQRSETRTQRHQSSWKAYAAEVGACEVAAAPLPEFDELTTGEVEAAHKSPRLMANVIARKQRRNRGEA
jgi:hypothetical protein